MEVADVRMVGTRRRGSPALVGLVALLLGVAVVGGGCGPKITPGQAAPGEIGYGCGSASDCTKVSSPICLSMSGGYCAEDCALLGQFGCPDESICHQLSDTAIYCLDGCLSKSDCRQGYRCQERPDLSVYFPDTGVGVCLPACSSNADCDTGLVCDTNSGDCVPKVSASAIVGSGCKSNADCNSGLCLLDFPGGYCSSSCGGHLATCEPGSGCYQLQSGSPFCLTVCDADSQCRQGYLCKLLETNEDGKAKGFCMPPSDPQPLGAICANGDHCLSGFCIAGWPSGYCSTTCDQCGSGVCHLDQCVVPCSADEGCRYGYVCEGTSSGAKGCIPGCQSNSDCTGGQSCDQASGRCKDFADQPTGTKDLVAKSLSLNGYGSDTIEFTVPPDVVSFAIIADSPGTEFLTLANLTAPGGQVIYDGFHPYTSSYVVFGTDQVFVALVPNTPQMLYGPGIWRAQFGTDGPQVNAAIRVVGKTANGVPSQGTLDMHLYFVGLTEFDAAGAKKNATFQQAIQKVGQIYGQVGIQLGEVTYNDITGAAASKLAVINSVDGPKSELSELFALSTQRAGGVNIFFVREIVGGNDGYIILGIAGGIPGPPGVHGGPHSGVAVGMTDYYEGATALASTIAHEAGHFLGLFHTSEATGTAHDPLADTAQCTSSSDKNFDGYVTPQECKGKGADNLMFWAAAVGAEKMTPDQGFVVLRNPSVE